MFRVYLFTRPSFDVCDVLLLGARLAARAPLQHLELFKMDKYTVIHYSMRANFGTTYRYSKAKPRVVVVVTERLARVLVLGGKVDGKERIGRIRVLIQSVESSNRCTVVRPDNPGLRGLSPF